MDHKFLTGAALLLASSLAAPASADDGRIDSLTIGQQAALEIYTDIIAMRTARGHQQVPVMVDYLVSRFKAGGFAEEDLMVSDYDSNGEPVQGLIVRYRGDGSSGEKPIVMLAHTDVVDALPEDWVRDPFELSFEDDYFFGRGTMDNKYGVMNLTQTFLRLKGEGWTPNRDVYLVFSGDEETDMISTQAQAKWVAENVDPEFILNSDAGGVDLADDFSPNAVLVQASEKTYATFELTVTNPGGHSSRPKSDNAIYELSEALTRIGRYKFPVRATDLTRAYLASRGQQVAGKLGDAMRAFAADPTDEEAIATLRANSGTVGTVGTTCVATMLRAGHAENALPQSATATVNCRIFPSVGAVATEARLREVVANDGVEFKLIGDVVESPESRLPESVRASLAKALKATWGTDMPIIPYMSSSGTDGMHYRTLGYDTIAMGGAGGRPQDNFNHGLNERLHVDPFLKGLDQWIIMLKELAGE